MSIKRKSIALIKIRISQFKGSKPKSLKLSLLFGILTSLFVSTSWASELAPTKPNIILIVMDDLGWHDTGFMGNRFIETPTLDRLAREGAVFTQAYANAPNCSPSRAAIMTGLYAPHTDMYTMIRGDMGDKRFQKKLTPPNKMYLEPRFTTLAEALHQQGYYTAHIGKWNLGTGPVRGPLGQGFDLNIGGYRGGPHSYFAPYGKELPGLQSAPAGEYLTDRLSSEVIKVIKQRGNSAAEQPFFIYLAHFAPHFPIEAPAETVAKYEQKKQQPEFSKTALFPPYAAMIDRADMGLQRILQALQKQGIDKNTLIVFTSDNGSHPRDTDMGGLRGGKSQLYEGGMRVPFLFWWPNMIQVQQIAEPVMGIDIFPTLMAAVSGTSSLLPLDGEDLSPLLMQKRSLPQRNLYWYFPAYTAEKPNLTGDFFMQRPALAVRQGPWKLIRDLEGNQHQLYNLNQDIGETQNLFKQQQRLGQQLLKDVDRWAVYQQVPLPLKDNPDYRPPNELDRWWFKLKNRLEW